MQRRQVVSRDEWLVARKALLVKEKAATRERDALSAERRRLPMVKIEKDYVFEGPDGKASLLDLFEGRRQLITYHFTFDPSWDEGCSSCSFLVDHLAPLAHLNSRDTSLAVISRAPMAKIEPFRARMGWSFPWFSSFDSDFNYDFHVSFTEDDSAKGEMYYNYQMRPFVSDEMSGLSVFIRDAAGAVFHTYSSFARGNEGFLGAYHYLDVTPNGRNETGPGHNLGDWVRHHDRYGDHGSVDATGRYVPGEASEPCCGPTA